MNSQIERRTLQMTELRVQRPITEGNTPVQPVIEGHAAVFNSYSEVLGFQMPFKERILPGAFKDSLQTDDIRALWNHDANYVLGRNRSGTLALNEDRKGLKVTITPPDTQWARDLMVSIERGDVSEMSFGFSVITERWLIEDGMDIRELSKVKLYDVSPVTFPAYPQTDVGVRSIEEVYEQRRLELQKQAEQQRQKEEETRLLQEKQAEEQRLKEEREAEEQRQKAETEAEGRRRLEEWEQRFNNLEKK